MTFCKHKNIFNKFYLYLGILDVVSELDDSILVLVHIRAKYTRAKLLLYTCFTFPGLREYSKAE